MAISGSPIACEPPVVQRADQVERVALELGVDAGRAGDVEDRVALVAEADAGVDRRQEAARPVGRAAADARCRSTSRRRPAGPAASAPRP